MATKLQLNVLDVFLLNEDLIDQSSKELVRTTSSLPSLDNNIAK